MSDKSKQKNKSQKKSFRDMDKSLMVDGLIAIGVNIVAFAIIWIAAGRPFSASYLILASAINIFGLIGMVLITLSLVAKGMRWPSVAGGAMLIVFWLSWAFIWVSGTVKIGTTLLFDKVSDIILSVFLLSFLLAVVLLIVGGVWTAKKGTIDVKKKA